MKSKEIDFRNKNSLSLKLTSYFTIKNEKILSISIALECFFQIAVSPFELLYRGVLQDVSLVDEDNTRAERLYFLHDVRGKDDGFLLADFFYHISDFYDLVRV